MKRIFSIVLVICMVLIPLCTAGIFATDTSRTYDFDLTINGSHEVQAKTGDILTVSLTLRRTDTSEAANIYGMQDEICYDPAFFEIVEGSSLVLTDVQTTDLRLMGGNHAFYMNYVSFQGGSKWNSTVLVGSFQIRVIGENGSSFLKNENCSVSVENGSESFQTSVQNVKVTISGECTVRFDPMNGEEVFSVNVPMGSKLEEPKSPAKEGYSFTGWYKDTQQKDAWNFKKDTVDSNITLYAGWKEAGNIEETKGNWIWGIAAAAGAALLILLFLLTGKKKVSFETEGGTPMRSVRVRKGDLLPMQPIPQKAGAEFTGWYRDQEHLHRWVFENDKVTENMTLYAGWR